MNVVMKMLEFVLIPVGVTVHGLGVATPVVLGFLPDYGRVFRRLWERHKNPVSWGCRPFFGLVVSYGAILNSWIVVLVGFIGLGTSWFWFPKPRNTPKWAEDFINKELEILTPDNPWDLKRVILPSIGLPLGMAGFATLLWLLTYPWNWLSLSIFVLMTVSKVIWSARQEETVVTPLVRLILAGYALGAVVGIPVFLLAR